MTEHKGKTALDRIVAGLPGVTEGPWEIFDGCSWRRIGTNHLSPIGRKDCAVLAPTVSPSDGHPDLYSSEANCQRNLEHIARCSPDVFREIAGYVDELRTALEFYSENWRVNCGDHGVPVALDPNDTLLNDWGDTAHKALYGVTKHDG